ncbi:unnamed protein product [Adineta ricciae]|uniref:EF-hand domain-containing protein n=1 Tax=Adineta ricciae TaxID=249248 RepID=A0A814MA62_ADIRI|nr:unnamed protein product [Adineta ricciae]
MSWYHSTLLNTDRRPSRIIASCKQFSRRVSVGISRAVRRIQVPDNRLDGGQSKNLQHPRSLDEIVKCTRFSKSEVRLLYRGFKQECPSGNVSEERLREIYVQIFPQGNALRYTHLLFSVLDRNHKGTFTFDDYILTLSVLCRGTIDEKLRWIFRLYDINGEGSITRDSVAEVILSFYDLLGRSVQPRVEEEDVQEHVDRIFESILSTSTEEIALEDFIEYCKHKPQLIESIQTLSCCI